MAKSSASGGNLPWGEPGSSSYWLWDHGPGTWAPWDLVRMPTKWGDTSTQPTGLQRNQGATAGRELSTMPAPARDTNSLIFHHSLALRNIREQLYNTLGSSIWIIWNLFRAIKETLEKCFLWFIVLDQNRYSLQCKKSRLFLHLKTSTYIYVASIPHVQVDHSTCWTRSVVRRPNELTQVYMCNERNRCSGVNKVYMYMKFTAHVWHKCKYLQKGCLFLKLLPEFLSMLALGNPAGWFSQE